MARIIPHVDVLWCFSVRVNWMRIGHSTQHSPTNINRPSPIGLLYVVCHWVYHILPSYSRTSNQDVDQWSRAYVDQEAQFGAGIRCAADLLNALNRWWRWHFERKLVGRCSKTFGKCKERPIADLYQNITNYRPDLFYRAFNIIDHEIYPTIKYMTKIIVWCPLPPPGPWRRMVVIPSSTRPKITCFKSSLG